jgi:arylsulfatase A-like enzyme
VRVNTPVSLRDLPATVLALAGVPQLNSGVLGTPLNPLWADSTAPRSEVISELSRHYRRGPAVRNRNGPMSSLVRDSLHVIRDGDDGIEGYNISSDGAEERNLAAGARRDTLTAALDTALARQQLAGKDGYARRTRAADRAARRVP